MAFYLSRERPGTDTMGALNGCPAPQELPGRAMPKLMGTLLDLGLGPEGNLERHLTTFNIHFDKLPC